MKKYSNHVIVCLNHFAMDSEEEIDYVRNFAYQNQVEFEVSNSFLEGGKGSLALAQKILSYTEEESFYQPLYDYEKSIEEKIEIVSKEIYRASHVIYLEQAKESLEEVKKLGYSNLPICIAKTQYSLSDDPKKIGQTEGYEVTVRDLKVCSGAGFIVVYMGNIMTMPGLSKTPALLQMDIDEKGDITGLF